MNTASLSLGKARGLKRLADGGGHFTMQAADQRPPISQLIAARCGIAVGAVSFADIVAVKRLARVLDYACAAGASGYLAGRAVGGKRCRRSPTSMPAAPRWRPMGSARCARWAHR
jgi:tagatose-1,6-bisphosphate aldolase